MFLHNVLFQIGSKFVIDLSSPTFFRIFVDASFWMVADFSDIRQCMCVFKFQFQFSVSIFRHCCRTNFVFFMQTKCYQHF